MFVLTSYGPSVLKEQEVTYGPMSAALLTIWSSQQSNYWSYTKSLQVLEHLKQELVSRLKGC